MAKKELTEFDIIKKQFSKLEKINQRLKNICECYYIAYDGTIYVKSLVGFIEKLIRLNNPEEINRFYGCMILPNQFFDFSKKAKKSKLTINATNKGYYFGQDDSDELTLMINTVNPDSEIDLQFIDLHIKPKMYKRLYEVYSNNEMYTLYEDNDKFNSLTNDEVDMIVNAKAIFLKFNGSDLTLTKHLILDIKKSDLVSIARVGYRKIEDNMMRVFYMIKHECDIYTSYTIFNTLQTCRQDNI